MVSKMYEVDFRKDVVMSASDVKEVDSVNKIGEEPAIYLEILRM